MSENDGKIVYTRAGLKELLSAKNGGFKGAISHMGFGDRGYIPTSSQTSLKNELERVAIVSFEELSDTQLRLSTKVSGPKHIEVYEIGVYLESGTLLGVFSANGELINFKSSNNSIIQKLIIDLSPLPADSVNIVIGEENLNLMMTEELMATTTATVISNTVLTKTLHNQMQITEKLRVMGV